MGVEIFVHYLNTDGELEPDSHINFRCLSTAELVLYVLFVCCIVLSG